MLLKEQSKLLPAKQGLGRAAVVSQHAGSGRESERTWHLVTEESVSGVCPVVGNPIDEQAYLRRGRRC